MKRIVFAAAIIGMTFCACGKKETTEGTGANDGKTVEAVQDTLTDVDRLEGKVVVSVKQEWFVIKDGFRWASMSAEATTDYLKSIESNGQNNVVKDVPDATLQQFPLVGEILPKLEYKKF